MTATPLPLSVSIVCKDNESTIGRTLDSVRGWAGEILAVDSGSTDATLHMLADAGARVIHQDWLGYVKQKQFALERCTNPWVLHLDSDESLEPELAEAVRQAVRRNDPGTGGYETNRMIWYAGRPLRHAWQPEWRLRLARRDHVHWTGQDPHDRMEITDPSLRVAKLPGNMRHDAIPSIAEFLARQVSHARVGADSAIARGKRGSVAKLALSPVGAWSKQMIARRAFMDGWRGWVAAAATASATLMKHAILLERSFGTTADDARPTS